MFLKKSYSRQIPQYDSEWKLIANSLIQNKNLLVMKLKYSTKHQQHDKEEEKKLKNQLNLPFITLNESGNRKFSC